MLLQRLVGPLFGPLTVGQRLVPIHRLARELVDDLTSPPAILACFFKHLPHLLLAEEAPGPVHLADAEPVEISLKVEDRLLRSRATVNPLILPPGLGDGSGRPRRGLDAGVEAAARPEVRLHPGVAHEHGEAWTAVDVDELGGAHVATDVEGEARDVDDGLRGDAEELKAIPDHTPLRRLVVGGLELLVVRHASRKLASGVAHVGRLCPGAALAVHLDHL